MDYIIHRKLEEIWYKTGGDRMLSRLFKAAEQAIPLFFVVIKNALRKTANGITKNSCWYFVYWFDVKLENGDRKATALLEVLVQFYGYFITCTFCETFVSCAAFHSFTFFQRFSAKRFYPPINFCYLP